jgi:hypothetical protein
MPEVFLTMNRRFRVRCNMTVSYLQ